MAQPGQIGRRTPRLLVSFLGCSRDKHGKGCVTTKETSVLHPTADVVLSAKSFVFSFCPHLSPFILNRSSFVSMLRTPLEEDPLLQVFH